MAKQVVIYLYHGLLHGKTNKQKNLLKHVKTQMNLSNGVASKNPETNSNTQCSIYIKFKFRKNYHGHRHHNGSGND